MYKNNRIAVIIPALNEEDSLGYVLDDIPEFIDQIIVADNGSTDSTAKIASDKGALVIFEPERGYGAACLKAMSVMNADSNIVVFLDADYSDYPEEITKLLDPITDDNNEIVIGSRMLSKESRAVLQPVARFGNWLSTFFIKLFWKYKFTDLGPFRAIKYHTLQELNMTDRNFGWTVELQIKAAKRKLKAVEVPVSYRSRIGESKISGTVTGSFKAGIKILYLIFKELFS